MLFLGVLSVIQLIALPGLLLIRFFPARRSVLQNVAYIFMLSLLGNYAAIFLLTAVGMYTRAVVMALFVLEAGAIGWLYRRQLVARAGDPLGRFSESLSKAASDFSAWLKKDFLSAGLYFIFSAIALGCVLWLLSLWVSEFDNVFNAWDAYASWDRWAEKWAENRIPGDTWEYPQLIPISYSLTYKFIGTTAVKFFSKSIMPLFSLVIVLMLMDLGRAKRSFGYMLGAGLALYAIVFLLRDYIAEGYVDIPVACFSLMALYTLQKIEDNQSEAEVKQGLLLGSLATAAATVTKQTGAYMLAFYPVLAYLWVVKGGKSLNRREGTRLLLRHLALAVLIVVPWYALAQYRITFGGNASNIQYVINDIYEGQSLSERFAAAVASLGKYVYFYVFLAFSLFVLNNRFRHIVLFIIFPFSILWALFLSYEYRNLAVALPMIGMASGVAVESWLARLSQPRDSGRALRIPTYGVVVVLVLALALFTVAVDAEQIIRQQIAAQRLIFEPAINDKLYRYFSSSGGPQSVISGYPVGWLPDLEDYWVNFRFNDYVVYKETLATHPHAELLLVRTDNSDARILAEIQAGIDVGDYQLIFTEANYILVHIPSGE